MISVNEGFEIDRHNKLVEHARFKIDTPENEKDMPPQKQIVTVAVPTKESEWGTKRVGDWIQTKSGVQFHLLDTRPEDFKIEDIAHALAMQCRFAGHTRHFYSVAEHSVRVAGAVKYQMECHEWETFGLTVKELTYAALMHDASDAYILDMPRPFKYLPEFKVYKDIEHKLMDQMAAALLFVYPKPEVVAWVDNVLLGTEARDLFDSPIGGWHLRYEHLNHKIRPWSPAKAKRKFLAMFYKLNPLGIKAPKRRFFFI